MNPLAFLLFRAVLMGLGATLTFDLWGQLLKRTLQLAPSNICLVGRWLCHMPEGTFRQANIALAPRRRAECAVGWIAHYLIGMAFASAFVALAGAGWLQHPTLVPALAFGLATVVAPFFVMQPLMGLGLAASKAPNPTLARVRTLLNHLAFGAGLYGVAWWVSVL